MKKKKNENRTINTIILTCLGVLIIVFLILGFTNSWYFELTFFQEPHFKITKEECWNETKSIEFTENYVKEKGVEFVWTCFLGEEKRTCYQVQTCEIVEVDITTPSMLLDETCKCISGVVKGWAILDEEEIDDFERTCEKYGPRGTTTCEILGELKCSKYKCEEDYFVEVLNQLK